jgi:hypothetical protein
VREPAALICRRLLHSLTRTVAACENTAATLCCQDPPGEGCDPSTNAAPPTSCQQSLPAGAAAWLGAQASPSPHQPLQHRHPPLPRQQQQTRMRPQLPPRLLQCQPGLQPTCRPAALPDHHPLRPAASGVGCCWGCRSGQLLETPAHDLQAGEETGRQVGRQSSSARHSVL